MEGVLKLFFVLCFLAVCLASNENHEGNYKEKDRNSEPGAKLMMKRAKEEDDDAKVEVVQDGKDESTKDKKTKEDKLPEEEESKKSEDTHDSDEEDAEHEDEHEDEHEEEEEEEVDPNAKIEVHDLFTPKDCVNKSKSGDLVVIHYTGWMDDGSLFDTTVDPNKGYMPFEFMLGTGTVIKGFERGVLDMCKGMKREIVIPPSLGYGKKGAGDIPGNTTLTYELEMFDIRAPPPHADMFSHIDSDGDKMLSKQEVSEYMRGQAEAHGMPTYDKSWKKHHKKVVQNIFEHEDTDEDGAISHDEFSGPKMMYHDEF